MKRKKRKKLILLLIISMFTSNMLLLNAHAAPEEVYENGELICPPELDDNTTCVPKYTNGKVTSVELTYEDTDITVKKIVTKKQTLGKYDVEFRVKGKGEEQILVPQPAYVLVAIDMSATIKDKIGTMKDAVEAFGKTLIPDGTKDSNFYLGLLQFANKVRVIQQFTNQKNLNRNDVKYLKYNDSNLGKKSHIEKAFEKAQELFNEVPTNAIKYLFIFGDGRYWSNNDTEVSKVLPRANNLKSDVTIYGARYKGSYSSDTISAKSSTKLGCTVGQKYNDCDALVMKKIVSTPSDTHYYPPAGSTDKWIELFETIAGNIKDSVGSQTLSYYAELEDEIGNDFSLTEDDSRIKKFNVGKLTTDEKVFGPFEIEINPEVSRGLHETNENVHFSYTTKDGPKEYNIKNNPEVYWAGDNENIYSCSGEASKNNTEKKNYPYYSKECTDNYKVRINVDNAKDGQKSFALLNGRGFPTSVNLSTDVKCTYTFKAQEYNTRMDQINKELENYNSLYNRSDIPENKEALDALIEANKDNKDFKEPTTTKVEIASKAALLQSEKDDMEQTLAYYKSLVGTNNNSSPDIDTYKQNFTEQKATTRVYYKNSSDYDELDLDKLSEPKITGSCNGSSGVVNGKTISVNKTCSFHMEKEMGLPETCLSMVDSEQKECTSGSNQLLSGGNKFYVDLEKPEGSVSVTVPGAGYYQNNNFILDKDENGDPACRFENSTNRLGFRQIDLNEPFLSEVDPNRGVGNNYLNDNFDFEKIIHDDTWSEEQDPEYFYEMSKVNIANIKSDTSSDQSGSYLGQSCYFTNKNKWWCRFTRNADYDGSDYGTRFFTRFNAYKEGID